MLNDARGGGELVVVVCGNLDRRTADDDGAPCVRKNREKMEERKRERKSFLVSLDWHWITSVRSSLIQVLLIELSFCWFVFVAVGGVERETRAHAKGGEKQQQQQQEIKEKEKRARASLSSL